MSDQSTRDAPAPPARGIWRSPPTTTGGLLCGIVGGVLAVLGGVGVMAAEPGGVLEPKAIQYLGALLAVAKGGVLCLGGLILVAIGAARRCIPRG
jgi:hypothetical protein